MILSDDFVLATVVDGRSIEAPNSLVATAERIALSDSWLLEATRR